MAHGEPGLVTSTVRRLRLIVHMSWRRWVPTAAEQSARAEWMTGRPELSEHQRQAAAAFRWTLVRQQSDQVSKDWTDDSR